MLARVIKICCGWLTGCILLLFFSVALESFGSESFDLSTSVSADTASGKEQFMLSGRSLSDSNHPSALTGMRVVRILPDRLPDQRPMVVKGEYNPYSATYEMGKLDVSELPPGQYQAEVVAIGLTGESEPFLIDFFIYEDAWDPALGEEDSDRDGLPDKWEEQQFGGLQWTGADDPDQDGILNYEELQRKSSAALQELPGPGVLGGEYWIAEDPGIGLATPFPVEDLSVPYPMQSLRKEVVIPSHLEPGHYAVGLRIQDEAGNWGETYLADIFVFVDEEKTIPLTKSIERIEYNYRDEITPSGGNALELDNSSFRETRGGVVVDSGLTAALDYGWNPVYYRAFDADGNYSRPILAYFEVQEESPKSSVEAYDIISQLGSLHFMGSGDILSGEALTLDAPLWVEFGGLRYSLMGAVGTGGAFTWSDSGPLSLTPDGWDSLTWLWDVFDARRLVTVLDAKGLATPSGTLPQYEYATFSVPEFYYESADVRYRCLGYTGTGSVPESGFGNSVTIFVTEDSQLRWLWQKEYRINMVARNGTAEGYREWYAEGSETDWVPVPADAYRFEKWDGDIQSEEEPGRFVVNAPMSVEAVFVPAEELELIVEEVDGTSRRTLHPRGTRLVIEPAVEADGDEWVRLVPRGWRLEGSVNSSGNGRKVDFEILRDTRLIWEPVRQIRLEPRVIPQGGKIIITGKQSSTDADWYDEGTIHIRAVSDEGWRFVSWYFQDWEEDAVTFYLHRRTPLVGRFAEVGYAGRWEVIYGGTLTSPNEAIAKFRSRIGAAWMQTYEVTAQQYADFLNWQRSAGYIEKSNRLSVRGQNPLSVPTPGLQTDWYRGSDWSLEAEHTNVIETLSIDFGESSPSAVSSGMTSVPIDEVDFFTLRARGEIFAETAGTYSFREFSDDEVILWLNGVEVLRDTSSGNSATGTVEIESGWNTIEIVYRETTGAAALRLEWLPEGASTWRVPDGESIRHHGLSPLDKQDIQYHGAFMFFDGGEYLDMDTPDCNIEQVDGVYRPKEGQAKHPVVDVTWYGATAYASWLSEATDEPMSIPNEWFWEWAASGGDSTVAGNYYPWGPYFLGASHAKANYFGVGNIDIYEGTSPIASFPAQNRLFDMAGNVFEWTDSLYEQGSPTEPFRVLRGGSWNQPTQFLAASNRQVYKNEYYSDKATGFRLSMVHEADFKIAGFVDVPAEAIDKTSPGFVGRSDPLVENFQLGYREVDKKSYVTFLNWALASGYARLEGATIFGNAENWYPEKRWFQVVEEAGIAEVGGVLVIQEMVADDAANYVSWYGAMAYCAYENLQHPERDHTLPEEWQWEAAMAQAGTDLQLQNSGTFGWDTPYPDNTGFWPAFYNVAGRVQEWMRNPAPNGASGKYSLRGGADNLADIFRDFEKENQYLDPESTRADVGFRMVVEFIEPAIRFPSRLLQFEVGEGTVAIQLEASSYQTNPVWTWALESAPDWITLTQNEGDHATLELAVPEDAETTSIEIALSDGGLTHAWNVPVEVIAEKPLPILGLPKELSIERDAGRVVLPLEVLSAPDSAPTWSVSGTGTSLEQTTGEQVNLMIDASIATSGLIEISVITDNGSGKALCALVVNERTLEFHELVSEIYIPEGDALTTIPIYVEGYAADASLNWTVEATESAGIDLLDVGFGTAVLSISGAANPQEIRVRVSNGAQSIDQPIQLRANEHAPRFMLTPNDTHVVAANGHAGFPLVAQDLDFEDALSWSIDTGQDWVYIEEVGRLESILWVNLNDPRASQSIGVTISDGKETTTENIAISVGNTEPELIGPTRIEMAPSSTFASRLYTLFDPDPGQKITLRAEGLPEGISSTLKENNGLEIHITEAFTGTSTFDIIYSDQIFTRTRTVEVVRLTADSLRIEGLPESLRLEQYAPRKQIPFTVEGNASGGSVSIYLQHENGFERLEVLGGNSYQIQLEPDMETGTYPIVVRAETVDQFASWTIEVEVYPYRLDPHHIVRIEYYLDDADTSLPGVPLELYDYPPQFDAVAARLLSEMSEELSLGWHQLGLQAIDHSGQRGEIYRVKFYVYEDIDRIGEAVTRPDGSIASSVWSVTPTVGDELAPVADSVYEDYNPGPVAVTRGERVFESLHGLNTLENSIYWGEYFINEDPGEGQGVAFFHDSASLNGDHIVTEFSIDVASLEVGEHVIGYRFLERGGEWSVTRMQKIFVFEDREPEEPYAPKVIKNEYFWDAVGGEGFGFGLPLENADSLSDVGVVSTPNLQTAPVDTGRHQVYVRFLDNDEDWGVVRRFELEIEEPDSALNLVNLHVESNIGLPGSNFDSLQLVGSTLTLNVPKTFVLGELTYANFGFVGQGNVPSFGSANTVTFQMQMASDITWIWGTDCEMIARSPYGVVTGPGNWVWYEDFSTGFGIYKPLESVTLSVPEFVDIALGERQYCTGWTGSGSVPTFGIDPTMTYTALDQYSEMDWTWQKHYLLEVEVSGKGRVFGNDEWIAEGQTEELRAVAEPGYKFLRWELEGSGSTSTLNVLMDAPKKVRAVFSDYKLWEVLPFSEERRFVDSYEDGATVDHSITRTLPWDVGSRIVITGWEGAGSVPDSGNGQATNFQISQDSEVRWTGIRQHWVETRPNNPALGGIVVDGMRTLAEGSWYDEGPIWVEADPEVNSRFVRWFNNPYLPKTGFGTQLLEPLFIGGVFRETEQHIPDWTEIPAGSLEASPNQHVPHFEKWVPAFSMSMTEVTNSQLAESLNQAKREGSVYVSDGIVYGKPEIYKQFDGFRIDYYSGLEDTPVYSQYASNASVVEQPDLVGPLTRIEIVGQIFLESGSPVPTLDVSGFGSVSIFWNHSNIVEGIALPYSGSLNSPEGWVDFKAVIVSTEAGCALSGFNIKSDSVSLPDTYIRSDANPIVEVHELYLYEVGMSPYEQNGLGAKLIHADDPWPAVSASGLLGRPVGADFLMEWKLPQSDSAQSVIIRSNLLENSPFFELSVKPDGTLSIANRETVGATIRTFNRPLQRQPIYSVRIELCDGYVYGSVLESGIWKDIRTATREQSGYRLQGPIRDSQIIGYRGQGGNGLALMVSEETPWTNYVDEPLLVLSDLHTQLTYETGVFSAAADQMNRPAVGMTYSGASIFAEWIEQRSDTSLNVGIPTEWQFERGFGVGEERYEAWGVHGDSEAFVNFAGSKASSDLALQNVGQKSSLNGIYDLAGNAWEWTSSQQIQNRTLWRTIRGGSFDQGNQYNFGTYRLFYGHRRFYSPAVGFRMVASQTEVSALGPYFEEIEYGYAPTEIESEYGYNLESTPSRVGSKLVANYEYSLFLNELWARGELIEMDGNIYLISSEGTPQHLLVDLTISNHIQFEENQFTASVAGYLLPALGISWYGATAYADWLSESMAGKRYKLPSVWELEYFSLISFQNNKSVYPIAMDSVVDGPGEWTRTSDQDDPQRTIVIGQPLEIFTEETGELITLNSESKTLCSKNVGFRIVETALDATSGSSVDGKWEVKVNAAAYEEGSSGWLSLAYSGVLTNSLNLLVTASDDRIDIPDAITFNAGDLYQEVDFSVLETEAINGRQTVQITVTLQDQTEVCTAEITIIDYSVPIYSLAVDTTELSTGDRIQLTISRTGDLTHPSTAYLIGSAVSGLSIPSEVHFAAGEDTVVVEGVATAASDTTGSLSVEGGWYKGQSTQIQFSSNSSSDSDADGLPDLWEELHGLSKSLSNAISDTDGDGRSDYDEYLFATNPVAPDQIQLGEMHRDGGVMKFEVPSFPGRQYWMEHSMNLIDWSAGEASEGTGSMLTLTAPYLEGGNFYRLGVDLMLPAQSLSLDANHRDVSVSGGDFEITVAGMPSESIQVRPNVEWITVSVAATDGDIITLQAVVSANTTGFDRIGTIQIGSNYFVVRQASL
jgi:formylglycine-generating enzyme required for sulfatase activity